jgi:hypothetical protein
MEDNIKFQLGLLHLLHLIVNVDGHIDEREREAMKKIREEEGIPDSVYSDFEKKATTASEDSIYQQGIAYLTDCTDEERLTVFVHLYKLAEADSNISPKEIRFLFFEQAVSTKWKKVSDLPSLRERKYVELSAKKDGKIWVLIQEDFSD